jgi:type VI secretion system protein ImpJ
MDKRKKVMWYEGMNLEPHHFQQSDRFHQSALNFRIRSVVAFDWGLLDLLIDKEALVNGRFVLLRTKGVMPDGYIFDVPDEEPLPPPRDFREIFPATENILPVHLVIPVEQERGKNYQREDEHGKRATRYTIKKITLPDETSGSDECEIEVARGAFQLHFGKDSPPGLSGIKLAEIVRSSDGKFLLSDRFIPTCLSLQASENLGIIARRLLELLVAKNDSLCLPQGSNRKKDWSPNDLIHVGLLQILSATIPVLNHAYSLSKMHPEQLYLILLTLAGQLSAYSSDPDVQPRKFPTYDHDNLTECFSLLEAKIRGLLESITPESRYISVPLEQKSESLFIGRIPDSVQLQKAKFILAVSGEVSDRKMIDEIPLNFRIASPDTINAVLGSFGRALSVSYCPVPPSGLPRREGVLYFEMRPGGPFWESICRSRAFAIFVPAELSSLKMELFAV